jgi:hypothetical protein
MFTASNLPPGVIASFHPGSTNVSTVVTFTVSPTASTGVTAVTINGQVADGETHTTTINLTID